MCLAEVWIILRTSLVAQMVKHLSTMRETRVRSLGQEDPLEKEMATKLQYSCLENPIDGLWFPLPSMLGPMTLCGVNAGT